MEDFVPYNLAVKLEQKGFKQGYNIFGYRPIFSDETTIKFISEIGAYEKEYFGENISAPTISQVLKWLREKKVISVEPCATPYNCWYYMIKYEGVIKVTYTNDKYKTYELAALAGIEYVIDNNFI